MMENGEEVVFIPEAYRFTLAHIPASWASSLAYLLGVPAILTVTQSIFVHSSVGFRWTYSYGLFAFMVWTMEFLAPHYYVFDGNGISRHNKWRIRKPNLKPELLATPNDVMGWQRTDWDGLPSIRLQIKADTYARIVYPKEFAGSQEELTAIHYLDAWKRRVIDLCKDQ